MELILILGFLAGFLQLVGYILYISNSNIEPEPVTWFMFAYGTAILVVLEWDGNASLPELILPTVCAILAVYVSFKCWIKARSINPRKWWPEDWWPEDTGDKISFISDILITVLYISAWLLATYNFLNPNQREFAVLTFLFLSNVSTIPAFYPILRSTIKNPRAENWLPWIVWSIAYCVLGVVTYLIQNEFWHSLMFYPVINALLHGLMGVVAINRVGDFINNSSKNNYS